MAVADHVLGKDPQPPILARAIEYDTWGVNVHDLQPGEIRRVTAVLNAYRHLASYKQAAAQQKTAAWTQAHPQSWEFVSRMIAERMRRKRNG